MFDYPKNVQDPAVCRNTHSAMVSTSEIVSRIFCFSLSQVFLVSGFDRD